MAGGAGALPAVCQAELTGGEEVDTTQDGFAKRALTDREIGPREVAPWIERCGEVAGSGDSAGACDSARQVIGAEQRRSTGFAEEAAEDIPLLGHEELAFEILDLLELRASGRGRCLFMYQRGGSRLRLKRALAAIGHKSDA